jgi:type III restriction enzyme
MFYEQIKSKRDTWLQSDDCSIKDVIAYIKRTNMMRYAQIEAISTYLFLKIAGNNKPLWQLFCDGFFNREIDLGIEPRWHYIRSPRQKMKIMNFFFVTLLKK